MWNSIERLRAALAAGIPRGMHAAGQTPSCPSRVPWRHRDGTRRPRASGRAGLPADRALAWHGLHMWTSAVRSPSAASRRGTCPARQAPPAPRLSSPKTLEIADAGDTVPAGRRRRRPHSGHRAFGVPGSFWESGNEELERGRGRRRVECASRRRCCPRTGGRAVARRGRGEWALVSVSTVGLCRLVDLGTTRRRGVRRASGHTHLSGRIGIRQGLGALHGLLVLWPSLVPRRCAAERSRRTPRTLPAC